MFLFPLALHHTQHGPPGRQTDRIVTDDANRGHHMENNSSDFSLMEETLRKNPGILSKPNPWGQLCQNKAFFSFL